MAGSGFAGVASAANQPADLTANDLPGNGTETDPYVITNASELQAMENDLDAFYTLGSDVDASGTSQWHGGTGFDPIGSECGQFCTDTMFTGGFEGAGYTISGLHIDRGGNKNVGLFGYTAGTISDVRLTGFYVNGSEQVGGLAGRSDGIIQYSSASGTVEGVTEVGLLVGESGGQATVKSSSASGSVTGNYRVGGLVGRAGGEVRNASASTDVNVVAGGQDAGGLIGQNFAQVRRSYATGPVGSDGKDFDQIGGLIGSNEANTIVEDSYATGSVGGDFRVGGLIGWEDSGGFVNRTYATGAVSGSATGGLIGASQDTYEFSYWDVETTDQKDTDSGGATGLTTAQMTGSAAQGNLTSFDFSSTWLTRTGGYPVLSWQVFQSETFEVSYDRFDAIVTEGETVTVPVTVENTGRVEGTQTVTLMVGGTVRDSARLTVRSGASKTFNLSWATTRGDAGSYTAVIASENDTEKPSITVEPADTPAPANFAVTVGGTNAPVAEGDTLTVDATVENTGELEGTQSVTLSAGGTQRDSTSMTLEPNDTETVTLDWVTSDGDAGSHTATVASANDSTSTSVSVEIGGDGSGDGGGGDDIGGGVGGGDSGSADNVQSAISKPLADDAPEEDGVQIRLKSTPVEEVSFKDENLDASGQVDVEHLKSPPESVAGEFGTENMVSSLNIEVPAGAEDSPAWIRFRLTTAELGDRDPASLVVVRVVNGENQRLPTEVGERLDGGVILEADTPGFSTFAVISTREESTPFQTQTPTESTSNPVGSTATPTDGATSTRKGSTATPTTMTASPPRTETPGGLPGFGLSVTLVALLLTSLYTYSRPR